MTQPSIHIIYSYYEKDDRYRTNLIYFLKYGYFKESNVDYTFVINGSHTVNFPKESNIKVIQRENTGFDFQGYYLGILSLKKKYNYYVFINSSVRGPYLPPYALTHLRWYQVFINLLQTDTHVKLVGSTINIQPPDPLLKLTQHAPHVQSYCFAMDQQCLDYLMSTNLFRHRYETKMDVIAYQEIGMSTLVLQNGWNLSCLIPEYQQINYLDRNYSDKIIGDVLWSKNKLGRVIHPYETIFFKVERDICNQEIETLTNHLLNIEDMRFLSNNTTNIAICFHLGYGEMFPQFAKYIKNVYKTGYNIDLYVTHQKNTDPIHLIKHQYPNTIFIQTARGCDTGAFLLQIEKIYHSRKRYDYIFKIHTKKKEDWRFELLNSIAGTSDDVITVCDSFKKDPQIGMICGAPRWLHRFDRINEPIITDICRRIHINIDQKSYFVGGTIFWVKWSIMKNFIETSSINLQHEYDLCELGYLINNKPTYTHSWERIFGYIVGHYDFKIVAATTLKRRPLMALTHNRHIITKVMYGISEKESKDITEQIRKINPIYLRTINTNEQWGDPYPERKKNLYIYFNNGQICVLGECNAHITPNNYQIHTLASNDLVFQLEDNDNFENYIMLKAHDQLGPYCLTYFDWMYYYHKYSPWIHHKTYDECLRHYIGYGIGANLATFDVGESLLNKYKIKLFAYYLPSYSTVTWKPLFKGHQIKLPSDNYHLNDFTVLRRHVNLAKMYGLNGFCFQHFWNNGSRRVHGPVEMFLSIDSLNLDFCLSWVTETVSTDKNDWIAHFNYVLPFFKNYRYVKIKNQPIFLISTTTNNTPLIQFWNQLATSEGFAGIFFIEILNDLSDEKIPHQNVTESNPFYLRSKFVNYCLDKKIYHSLDYYHLCHDIINSKNDYPVYFRNVFVGFDNTYNNKEKCKMICEQVSAKAIYCTLKAQIENILAKPNPDGIDNLIFLQSWNDWANQMVIEPDRSGNNEILNAINNLVHQYHNPQTYNKAPDLIL